MCSFNLNLSSEPSIETLPEYNCNGIINTNVINDQTIAIVCSDTSRELDNLTEELQHSDLSRIRKSSHQNGSKSSTVHQMNELELDAQKNDAIYKDYSSSYDDNCYEYSQSSRTNVNHCSDNNISNVKYSTVDSNSKCNNIDEDLETSPYYTHLSQDLRNNLNNLTLRSSGNNGFYSGQETDFSDTVDGIHFDGGNSNTDNNGDIDGMPDCMLQSVDLRGIYFL